MLWRALIVAGYTAAFAAVVYAAMCGSAKGRRFVPIVLAVSGTWIIFYTALIFGVAPLSPWLVAVARMAHVLTFTTGIFAGLALREQGVADAAHADRIAGLETELRVLKTEMTTMEWD